MTDTTLRVALIGDRSDDVIAHQAIPPALELACRRLGLRQEHDWLHTASLAQPTTPTLAPYDAIWAVPASPYANQHAAIDAIRHARERDIPFLGTCGGYQHALLEYARNVLGREDADSFEDNPDTLFPLVSPMVCELRDTGGDITLATDSELAGFYGKSLIRETYNCGFGLNRDFQHLFDDSGLLFVAHDLAGDPRALTLPQHRFFYGVAFQPERSSLQDQSHPLIEAFLHAACKRKA